MGGERADCVGSQRKLETCKYTSVELPAVCLTLKALEAGRVEVLATCLWRALNAFGEMPAAHAESAEERTLAAAAAKGQQRHEAVL